MGDTLLALSIPVLVFAAGIYAAGESWWRRRHPAPPSPYTHQAARLAEQAMLVDAERIVDGAYVTLGSLYDGPSAPEAPFPATDAAPGPTTARDRSRQASTPARRN
ncbi:hypothetical protein ACFVW8_19985 [Streptomyces sp. NPDC058221]|uniref:hypothetical protein n=1 Tax=Streptomyces sp. NPDC058221 TaxID=3346388 RepID=UPI0036E2FFDD